MRDSDLIAKLTKKTQSINDILSFFINHLLLDNQPTIRKPFNIWI